MPKGSDLRNKMGLGSAGGANPFAPPPSISLTPPAKADVPEDQGHSQKPGGPDRGHNLANKAAKAKGGAGGSAGRPKV
ncbi:MAG TPA: hypothetical protein VD971_09570 [Phycisphaerales bacterium]|nr:hypothetical protein [Phycisphaerales bacterium]